MPQKRGGRKRGLETLAGLEATFCCVLKDRTAGDPLREESIWTDLTPGQIAAAWAEQGTPVSEPGVRHLLAEQGYGRRQAQKSAALGEHPDRDAQFRNIARLRAAYLASPDPLLSSDTKKRELLGNFYRKGSTWGMSTGGPATTRASSPATVWGKGGRTSGARRIRTLTPCSCCATAGAATAPPTGCSRKICSGW